jgi:DNA replication protein DnaC
VILDDIGYVQQSRDEIEVLFTFLAERYERKSVPSPATSSSATGFASSRTP